MDSSGVEKMTGEVILECPNCGFAVESNMSDYYQFKNIKCPGCLIKLEIKNGNTKRWKLEIKHLCQECNKEFIIPESSISENRLGRFIATVVCPHCKTQNQIWIRIITQKQELKR